MRVHKTIIHYYYPPGYGLHLFGLIIPFPPAPVLWVAAVLDIVITIWVWRRPALWGIMAAGLVVSAYLFIVGIFSIGVIYFALGMVQLARLVQLVSQRYRRT